MNTKENSINIHEYPENASPLELARYQVAVMEAAERGAPVEMYGATVELWILHKNPEWRWHSPQMQRGLRYRIARPKIAEGHNPDKLTVDQVQVQDGWRLLTVEECKECERQFREGEWLDGWFYNRHEERWRVGSYRDDGYTYRTRQPIGHYLPKPEPVKKMVPWTFETAPKGCVLVRQKGVDSIVELVVGWTPDLLRMSQCRACNWHSLAECFEHSVDNGKTWLPCGTEA